MENSQTMTGWQMIQRKIQEVRFEIDDLLCELKPQSPWMPKHVNAMLAIETRMVNLAELVTAQQAIFAAMTRAANAIIAKGGAQ